MTAQIVKGDMNTELLCTIGFCSDMTLFTKYS